MGWGLVWRVKLHLDPVPMYKTVPHSALVVLVCWP